MQAELDNWRWKVNTYTKRSDKHKVLPHGRPALIFESPESFGCYDFKVTKLIDIPTVVTYIVLLLQIPVSEEIIAEAERQFTKPGTVVHELVAPPFHIKALELYNNIGCPTVTRETVWDVYHNLLGEFLAWDAMEIPDGGGLHPGLNHEPFPSKHIPLLQGLQRLPYGPNHLLDKAGSIYMGGRPNAFLDLPSRIEQAIVGDTSSDVEREDSEGAGSEGEEIFEIPILECDISDFEHKDGESETGDGEFLL